MRHVVPTALLLTVICAAAAARADEQLHWHSSLRAALAEAETAAKPVFVYVKDTE